MSVVAEELPEAVPSEPVAMRAESLATSVAILLVMTVAQRLIGFGRGVLFCRWLNPEQLGQWDIAFGFVNLAATAVVLGLPGSFGRYVEYFRQRGQFHLFLRRTSVVSLAMSVVAATAMIVERDWFSRLIFGTSTDGALVIPLALCLAVIIWHNYLTALFIAVRRYRVVTILQFAQSLAFALVSLTLLIVRRLGAESVIIGYAVATVVSGAGAIAWLRELNAAERPAKQPMGLGPFWAKLVPFAIWMWVTNLLAGLFEVIDRFLIIHHSGIPSDEALSEVGVYHSARLIPLLFVAVAGLLGSLVTPHLSHDWEAGRRESVTRRLNMILKLLLGSLLCASVATLFFAPVLFDVAFHNKFEGGTAVLPLSLAYCIWFGTTAVAQNYLWCARAPLLSTLALFAGLVLNVSLNLVLLPLYGLEGAATATALANLTALLLVFAFSRWYGMRIDRGVWLLSIVPVTLVLGPWPAFGVLTVLLAAAGLTRGIFNRDEKQELVRGCRLAWHKLRRGTARVVSWLFVPALK